MFAFPNASFIEPSVLAYAAIAFLLHYASFSTAYGTSMLSAKITAKAVAGGFLAGTIALGCAEWLIASPNPYPTLGTTMGAYAAFGGLPGAIVAGILSLIRR